MKQINTIKRGDKIITTTTVTKKGKRTVTVETKKGNCLLVKSKIVYNTRTTYLTVISNKEFLYDSIRCNKLINTEIKK